MCGAEKGGRMKNNHMKHRRFLEGSTHYHCNALCGNAILKRENKLPSFARTVCFSNVPRFSEEGGFDLGESSAVEEERPDIDDTASFFTAAFRSRNCCFLLSARTSSASGSRIAKKKLHSPLRGSCRVSRQRRLAYKKTPTRNVIRPYALAYCRVLGGCGFLCTPVPLETRKERILNVGILILRQLSFTVFRISEYRYPTVFYI